MTTTADQAEETAELFPVSPELAQASARVRIFNGLAHETRMVPLHGFPQQGVEPGWGNERRSSLFLDLGPDGAVLLESGSVEWWDAHIARAQAARDQLVYPVRLDDVRAPGGLRRTLARLGQLMSGGVR